MTITSRPGLKTLLLTCIFLASQAFTLPDPGKKPRQVRFKKHILTTAFVSEGVATGDVNKDGRIDIMAGAYWFEAPNWVKHEIVKGETFYPKTGYSNSFLNFSLDVNLDGWVDLIRVGIPGRVAMWYENPRNEAGYWKTHFVYPAVGNESPLFVDIDGDGREDLLFADAVEKKMLWLRAPISAQDTGWTTFAFSTHKERGTSKPTTHGLGFEDMNLDGRKDVLIKDGWWEAPPDPKQPDWVFHPADLGEDCAEMYTMDVDNDGDKDVLTSSAHHYGIWWHEQVKDPAGNISWKHHEIFKEFSQSHGLALVDINKDGYPDLVTGKRYLAHTAGDPGDAEPSVLYWFEFKPGRTPSWIPHKIDDSSGVGLHLVTRDMNKDKLTDIVVSNKNGVFLFEQLKK